MSSYDALESSVEGSRPIEVYKFAIGTEVYRYTSAEDDVTVGADTYVAEAISRGPIAQGHDDRNRILDITLPADNVFAAKYIDIVPGQRATGTIIRLQRDEVPTFNTQVVIYKGFVRSVRFPGNGREAVIGILSIEAATSRPIPRFTYQGLCNHVLYDGGCGVNSTNYRMTGTVTAVNGNVITVSGASGEADGYYTAGFVTPTGLTDFRMVLKHVGDDLTLLLPFPVGLTGQTIDVFAGCNHMISGHCQTRFNNVIEHGGFAFVPKKNPFTTKLV